MKRLLIALLLSFALIPAFADEPQIKFKAEIVEAAIAEYVAPENRKQTAAMYDKQIDDTGAITIKGLYKVCYEAGFNIYGAGNGFDDCRRFIEYMVSRTITKGQGTLDQCNDVLGGTMLTGTTKQCVGKDGKPVVYAKACNGEAGKCITDFAGLATQTPTGKQFIYQWGKLQNPALTMTCANFPYETRRGLTSPLGQDFLRCTAGGIAYEFEFDSLNKTPGDASTASENAAMCKLFGGKEVPAPDSTDKKFNFLCDVPGGCSPMQSFATTIGLNVTSGGYCMLSKDSHKTSGMWPQTAFGIDNYIFFNYKPVQTRAEIAQKKLEEYLRTVVGNSSSVSCNPSIKKINTMAKGNYIMTCHAGGQQIDFVFDNLTTASETRSMAGAEKMDCMIAKGNFTGKECIGLNETQCNKIKKATKVSCPECSLAEWDKTEKICKLPNATSTTKLDKGLKIGGMVAGVAAGAVLTVFMGPGGIAMIVFVTAETAGGVIEITNEIIMSGEAEKFLNKVRNCNDKVCAEQYVKEMQRMSNLSSRFEGDEVQAIDNIFSKLIDLLDKDSDIFDEFRKKQTLAANQKGFFDPASWEKEQAWAAIGLSLQLTSLASALFKTTATKFLPKATQKLEAKLGNIVKNSKVLTAVDDASYITKAQKGGREALKESIAAGKKVEGVSVANTEIPKGQMASPIDIAKERADYVAIQTRYREIDAMSNLTTTEKNALKEKFLVSRMDADKIVYEARQYKAAAIEAISENTDLMDYAARFKTLGQTEKNIFANRLVQEVEGKLCEGGVCKNVVVASGDDFARSGQAGARGVASDGIVYINKDAVAPNMLKNYNVDNKTLDGFFSTLAHEHGAHVIDDLASGTGGLSRSVANASDEFIKPGSLNLTNPKEINAYNFEHWASQDFSDDLLRYLNALDAP